MRFLKRFTTAWRVLRTKAGAFERAFLKGLDIERDTITDPYREHAWVYACINVIMRKISSVPFVIASRQKDDQGNQQELENHPARRLFDKVNPLMSLTELWQGTVLDLLNKHGSSIWIFDIGLNGKPTQIILAPNPSDAKPIVSPLGQLIGWKVKGQKGAAVPFSIGEFVRFRFLHPSDPFKGLAPTEAAKLSIEQDHKASKHNLGMLKNSGVPRGVISIPDLIDKKELKRLQKMWEENHQGDANKGRIAWLIGGMEFKAEGLTMQELDFTEGKRLVREEILATFGVPPAEVGVHEFSNYANAKEQARKFWNNMLLPILVMLEETLDTRLFKIHYPDAVGFFDLTNVEDLQDNLESKATTAQILFGMGVPMSDINDRLQMGFDMTGREWLDDGVRTLAQIRVGRVPQETPPVIPAPGTLPTLPPAATSLQTAIAKDRVEVRQNLYRNYLARTNRGQARMTPRMQGYFSSEGERVAANTLRHYSEVRNRNEAAVQGFIEKWDCIRRVFGKSEGSKEKAKATFRKYVAEELKTLSSDIESLIFSFDESTAALTPIIESEATALVSEGGSSIATIAGLSFDANAPGVVEAIGSRVNQIVTFRGSGANIPQDTFERVRESLIGSINSGDSVAVAAGKIENLYEDFQGPRSVLIAQTENGFGFNTGAFELYDQAGITLHEWVTAGDTDVRDSHLVAEAAGPREVGKQFPNGLIYPNDPAGGPEEVIACRCTTAPFVENLALTGYTQKFTRGRMALRAKSQSVRLT